jgi:hypothetical protein
MRSKREFFEKVLKAKKSELDNLEKHTPKFKGGIPPAKYRSIPKSGGGNRKIGEINEKSHKAARAFEIEGIVKEVSEEEIIVCAPHFIKQEEGGKERWIWVGDHTNECVESEPYKVETAEFVREWIRKGYHGFHLDVRKAFYHGNLDEKFRKYFGFATRDENDKIHYWVFTCLPMGYKLSPVIFYRLMTPIMRYLRKRGIMISLFVDDAIGQAEGEEETREQGDFVKETLIKAGVTLSEKCDWEPKQEIEHIGYIWNLKEGTIRLTDKRKKKVKEGLEKVKGEIGSRVTHRQIAKSAGRVISTRMINGNVVRLLTRALFKEVAPETEKEWDKETRITERIHKEVRLLEKVMEKDREIPFVKEIKKIETDLKTDASGTGVGGFLRLLKGKEINRRTAAPLPEGITEKESSCLREMLGGIIVVEENGEDLKGSRFELGSDNQGAVRVFQVGSRVEELQDCAIEMYMLCLIELEGAEPRFYWIRREENTEADEGSKDEDHNDYQMSKSGLERMIKELKLDEKNLIDAFGNPWDELRKRGIQFWSRYFFKGCSGVDARIKTWGGREEILWIFPPIPMLVAVVAKIEREEGRGVVVLPIWPNRPYMPMLFDKNGHGKEMIKEWKILMKGEIVMGRQGKPWFLTRPVEGERSQFIAIKIDARKEAGGKKGPTLCMHIYFTGRCEICKKD